MSNLSDFIGAARSRFGKLLLIEQAIRQVSPDYLEAADILDALMGAMDQKYDGLLGEDIPHEAKQLKAAFEEADRIEHRPADEMDEARRWRDRDL